MTAVTPLDSLAHRIPIVANEDWRWVPGYEDLYAVSSHGRVASFHPYNGDPGPRILRPGIDSGGYHSYGLARNGERKTWHGHRLVLLAFVGPLPDGHETRHLDGDPTNNALSNLAYGTVSENARDRVKHGTHSMSRKARCPQGHPYDADNTDLYRGTRRCKTCQSEHSKQQWRERRAAALSQLPRVCRRCSGPIPPRKRIDAKYCSVACRKGKQEVSL